MQSLVAKGRKLMAAAAVMASLSGCIGLRNEAADALFMEADSQESRILRLAVGTAVALEYASSDRVQDPTVKAFALRKARDIAWRLGGMMARTQSRALVSSADTVQNFMPFYEMEMLNAVHDFTDMSVALLPKSKLKLVDFTSADPLVLVGRILRVMRDAAPVVEMVQAGSIDALDLQLLTIGYLDNGPDAATARTLFKSGGPDATKRELVRKVFETDKRGYLQKPTAAMVAKVFSAVSGACVINRWDEIKEDGRGLNCDAPRGSFACTSGLQQDGGSGFFRDMKMCRDTNPAVAN